MQLFPHQERAVNELHNGAILWGDVGTGKTMVAAAYYKKNYTGYGEDLDVYVITTAKKRDSLDWHREFARLGVGSVPEGSVAGLLHVDSWNNLHRYRDVERAFFVFDEQRVVGSGKWTKDFIRIASRNQWILLSATPGDTWLDYIPVFVANGFYRNRTDFLQQHVIFTRYSKFPKVDRYVGVNKLVRLRNHTLVHMPYERHTERETTFVPVEYDHQLFERALKQRWHVYEERPLRDVSELFLVMRKIVNLSPSRVKELESLIQKHPKLIVFYNHDTELMVLRNWFADWEQRVTASTLMGSSTDTMTENGPRSTEMISKGSSTPSQEATTPSSSEGSSATTSGISSSSVEECSQQYPSNSLRNSSKKASDERSQTKSGTGHETVAIAEWNGHRHQPIPKTDSWVYLVQYQAGAEGWNCTETDAMLFYSLTYSYKNFHQAHGRIDRLNTPFKTLKYYIFMSNSVIDKLIWRSLQDKKNFNESKALAGLDTHSA